MKIITLTNNTTYSENLKAEHGLSVYIEIEDHKILFDTGKSDVFIHNANELNIDLQAIDTAVISHGHYDHLGGLINFLQLNQTAKVYLKKEIFDYQYLSVRNELQKNIGYPEELKEFTNRFVFLENDVLIKNELVFISKIDHPYPQPKGNKILFKTDGKTKIQDDFLHELIFAINAVDGLYVFSGCAHNGILNMLATVKKYFPEKNIKLIFGGLHLIDNNEFVETETTDELKHISQEIIKLSNQAKLYTGHCSGKNASKEIESILGNCFHLFYSGLQIKI